MSASPSTAVPRVGGRLLLVDPDERVLLIHERLEAGGSHWLTPGGGLEPGERPIEAAVREASEEIGLDVQLAADAAPVLVTRRRWSWRETTYDQTDYYFLLRVAAGLRAAPRHLTEPERLTLLGHRWWTLPELRGTVEDVVPRGLAEVLAPLLGGAPTIP